MSFRYACYECSTRLIWKENLCRECWAEENEEQNQPNDDQEE